MATLTQAEWAFYSSRVFFGQSGALKSNNKMYIDSSQDDNVAATTLANAKGISQADALEKVQERAAARLQAKGQGEYTDRSGLTPIELGELIVKMNKPTGNCGVMACVAMYFANRRAPRVPADELWMVTVYNKWTTTPGFNMNWMKFGHSWALLGAGTGQEFIADPWAGVVCAKDDYEAEMKKKLNKWAGQGKRILVQFTQNAMWLTSNDKAVLSLFGFGATTETMRGDERFA